jgi:hypothetical protein
LKVKSDPLPQDLTDTYHQPPNVHYKNGWNCENQQKTLDTQGHIKNFGMAKYQIFDFQFNRHRALQN